MDLQIEISKLFYLDLYINEATGANAVTIANCVTGAYEATSAPTIR
jgi:hypothetical protein